MFIIECLKWEKETLRTILLCTLVILPLCFVKDWESLSILSKIKAVVYASLVLFVLIVPPFDQWTQENVVRDMDDFIHDQKTWFSLNIYKSLGTFTFAAFVVAFPPSIVCAIALSFTFEVILSSPEIFILIASI